MDKQAYLILQNGMVFAGARFGAEGEAVGEVVFTTGMTGYLEALTDPSYHGQILVQTFPLIGNYGVIEEDFESQAPQVRAYIVRECCQAPSNFRCEGTLEAYLKERNVIGLAGIDTRALTRAIRENGVMNGIITDSDTLTDEQQAMLNAYAVRGAVQAVSGQAARRYEAEGETKHRVALWDFGTKASLIRKLQQRGCEVTVWPANSAAAEILADKPEGVVLSAGPGDPAENPALIEQVGQLCRAKLPTLGIGLGHQLMALAQGAKTYKLKHGHRGANQPVKDLQTGRVRATSQNHGYAVESESVQAPGKVCLINVNDGTCAGIAYEAWGYSVQCSETEDVLDAWASRMEGGNGHAAF